MEAGILTSLLIAASLVRLGYGLDLTPDALVADGTEEFWLSEKNPAVADSLFFGLPKSDREKVLSHIQLPGDRKEIFGDDALVRLAADEHDLSGFSRVRDLKDWLPPGASAVLSAFDKQDEVKEARKTCLVAAYDLALSDYLIEKLGDAGFPDDALRFIDDVVLCGPVSLSGPDALSLFKNLAETGKGSGSCLSLLEKHRKKALSEYRTSLTLYYSLRETQSGQSARVRELYLKGVEAYSEGDYPRAVTYWQSVLKLDPGNQDAAEGIEKAKKHLGK